MALEKVSARKILSDREIYVWEALSFLPRCFFFSQWRPTNGRRKKIAINFISDNFEFIPTEKEAITSQLRTFLIPFSLY
jgi:hypothetical protein